MYRQFNKNDKEPENMREISKDYYYGEFDPGSG